MSEELKPEAAPVEPVAAREEYPLTAALWKREPYGGCPDGEWVLEIRGSINDTYFINRHTQPINTPAEDVAGLPTLYTHPPAAPTDALVEALNGYLSDCTNDECERCQNARAALAAMQEAKP